MVFYIYNIFKEKIWAHLIRQVLTTPPWHTERHGYDPTCEMIQSGMAEDN